MSVSRRSSRAAHADLERVRAERRVADLRERALQLPPRGGERARHGVQIERARRLAFDHLDGLVVKSPPPVNRCFSHLHPPEVRRWRWTHALPHQRHGPATHSVVGEGEDVRAGSRPARTSLRHQMLRLIDVPCGIFCASDGTRIPCVAANSCDAAGIRTHVPGTCRRARRASREPSGVDDGGRSVVADRADGSLAKGAGNVCCSNGRGCRFGGACRLGRRKVAGLSG